MKNLPTPLPPLSVLQEAFELHADGSLTWKERPVHHFNSGWKVTDWNRRYAYTKVGGLDRGGYLRVNFMGKHYNVHRIVYALANGVCPGLSHIDHIDGDRSNNAPENLRLSTQEQNMCNRVTGKNNTTGVKGLMRRSDGGWLAQIRYQGMKYTKHSFRKEVALNWLIDKRRELHGEFANSGVDL